MRRLLPGLLFAALLLAATNASAAKSSGWSTTLEVMTDLPLDVGARLQVEAPYRIRIGTSLGFLPGGYVDLVNELVIATGGYDRTTARVVSSALSSSLVWRTHVGWRPFPALGFYFEAGYGLVTLGGGVAGEQLLDLSLDRDESLDAVRANLTYDVSSTLHMLDVEVGWRWLLREHLSLRVAVGVAVTLGARSSVSPGFRPQYPAKADQFGYDVARWLDDLYTSYVHVPTVSVGVGYRF